jgi:hypothetical protein
LKWIAQKLGFEQLKRPVNRSFWKPSGRWPRREAGLAAGTLWRGILLTLACAASALAAEEAGLTKLERSYWLHASLASRPLRGYWGMDFPAAAKPSEAEIRNAVRLLSGDYAANRLYLIYHGELPGADAEAVFTAWRRFCPRKVELVPTLVLRAYDKQRSEVFAADDLARLAAFFRRNLNRARLGIYDVEGGRDQGPALAALAREFPGGLIRVGIQPDEAIGPEFASVVQDTWSGFCHGKSNEDWQQPGFGAETLRRWLEQRNRGRQPVAWDLITVAWDYTASKRGEYPGYDDAQKNMPLPVGRNELAAREILSRASRQMLAGFSSDLWILHVNSRAPTHDGPAGGFYETLKRGQAYRGYYSAPFGEVTALFRTLKKGKIPKPLPLAAAQR